MPKPSPTEIIKAFGRAESDRRVWESHWQDVADLIRPTSAFTRTNVPGSRKRRYIYDDTATKAAQRSAAAIYSLVANPAIKWFNIGSKSAEQNEKRDSRAWMKMAVDHALAIFNAPSSGFAQHLHETIFDLVTFNTGVFMVLDGSPARFTSRPLSETYLKEDVDGNVVGVFRKFTMRANELIAREEEWSLSEKVRELKNSDRPDALDTDITVLHYVYKRDDRDPTMSDGPNKAWASVYIDIDSKHLMHVGGFDRNPYKTPRWSKASGEAYGRGPGIEALPSIRGLNIMKKTMLEAGEKSVHPPLQVPVRGIDGPVHTAPNSLIYYNGVAGSGGPITPLKGTDPESGQATLEEERKNVAEMFYLDLIQLPEIDRMTATEVMERVQQKLGVMAPVLGRITGELLGPIIQDTIEIEIKGGRLAPPPEDLARAGLTIEYVSPLALAQRASEATNIMRLFNAAAPLGPEAMRTINPDRVTRALSSYYNVDPKLMNSEEETAAIMEQENAMAQAVQGSEAARNVGSAVKDVASASQR